MFLNVAACVRKLYDASTGSCNQLTMMGGSLLDGSVLIQKDVPRKSRL